MLRYGMLQYDMLRYGLLQYDMLRYGLLRYDMLRYGMLHETIFNATCKTRRSRIALKSCNILR